MIDSASLFIFLGSILMVLNIVRYALFSRSAFRTEGWSRGKAILNLPLLLLILFLLGYITQFTYDFLQKVFPDPSMIFRAIMI